MEYKWAVNKVQVAEDNLVVRVYLTITGTDGDLSASAVYVRTLTRGENFVPYEQLTEQQVLNWCFEPEIITWKTDVEKSIIRHLKNEGENQVTDKITQQLAQKAAEPALPWAV